MNKIKGIRKTNAKIHLIMWKYLKYTKQIKRRPHAIKSKWKRKIQLNFMGSFTNTSCLIIQLNFMVSVVITQTIYKIQDWRVVSNEKHEFPSLINFTMWLITSLERSFDIIYVFLVFCCLDLDLALDTSCPIIVV